MIRRIFSSFLALVLCLSLSACSVKPQSKVYLYGETHGNPAITALELELWQEYYHNQGMRHLFVEFGYFTTAYLNMWMQAEDDSILLELYEDWEGTTIQIEDTLDYFRTIKDTCPETVFHGTDVGHQYWNTGERYLKYLEEQNLTDSIEYQVTLESIEQGKAFYCSGLGSWNRDHVYREKAMAENFIRELEALDGASIMGIYGMAHVKLDSLNHTGECDSMGKQLLSHFGDIFVTEDLTRRVQLAAEPEKRETLTINGVSFEAEYFGCRPLSVSYYEYCQVEYWRLLDACEKFSKAGFTGNTLEETNYPMALEEGGAYVVQYTYPDGRVIRRYYFCDGTVSQDQFLTKEVYSSKIK